MDARLAKSSPGCCVDRLSLSRPDQQPDLQAMLANEKMRSEHHKLNYQALKTEHTRLQRVNMDLEDEVRSLTEKSKTIKDKYQDELEQAQSDLHTKISECNTMQGQVLSEQKLELLRLECRDDLEIPFRERMQQVYSELEATRAECTRLKYENAFVKSELEHSQGAAQAVEHEMELRHDAEVSGLRREREAMLARSQATDSDAQRVRVLQRENAQVQLRARCLLGELEELRSERERDGLQSDHITRLQSKQLSEQAASLKALQVERDALRDQADSQQRELCAACDRHSQLSGRLQDLERSNTELRCRAEAAEHGRKVEQAEAKVEALRERGDVQRERDKLASAVEELQCQMETARLSLEQMSCSLEEKERSTVTRIQAVQQEEWQKQHALEDEKLELETRLQDFARQRIDEEAVLHAEREKLQQQMTLAGDAKDDAVREAQMSRSCTQQQAAAVDQLARSQSDNANLQARIVLIETQYSSYMQSEQQVAEVNDRLRRQVESLTHAVEATERELERSKEMASQLLAEHKMAASTGQLQLQSRIAELDEELARATVKYAEGATDQAKKKKRIAKVLTKLRDKGTLLQARVSELTTENDALRQAIVPNASQHKRQLHKLMRCHEELRSTLQTGVPLLPKSDPSLTARLDTMVPHQKDLQLVKQRIELLNDNQRQQMEAMSYRPGAITTATLAKLCSSLDSDPEKENAE